MHAVILNPSTATPTQKLKGSPLAEEIKLYVIENAARLAADGVKPKMAVILASEDAASVSYAQSKQRMAAQLGIQLDIHDLGSGTSQEHLHETCLHDVLERVAATNAGPPRRLRDFWFHNPQRRPVAHLTLPNAEKADQVATFETIPPLNNNHEQILRQTLSSVKQNL